MMDLEARFPHVPVGYPEGADSRWPTYLHLLIGRLESDALTRLVGNQEPNRVIAFWAGDHTACRCRLGSGEADE